MPFGGYRTFPPLTATGPHATCFVQRTAAIQGFALPAGGTARVLELVHAVQAGSYHQDGVDVTYRQNSKTVHQHLRSVITGTVSANARALKVSHALRHCLTKARGLTDGTA